MRRCVIMVPIFAFTCGCDVFFPGWRGGAETGSPELKRFLSERELAEYLSEQITTRNSQFDTFDRVGIMESDALADSAPPVGGSEPPLLGAPDAGAGTDAGDADGSPGSFSQTTIQEEGVDEADVVKTDGDYLYIIKR